MVSAKIKAAIEGLALERPPLPIRSICRQVRQFAFLLERGLIFAQTPAKLKAAMADVLENAEADLTPMMRNLIDTLWVEWKQVEQQITELTDKLTIPVN